MKKRMLITLVLCCAMGLLGDSLSAADTVRDTIAEKYSISKDICPVIRSSIREGMSTQEIVKTSILMGHKPCYVIKCAADGGGTLEQIIYGAIEAATSADVISRCCVDAGFDPQNVAGILEGEAYDPGPSSAGSWTTYPGGDRNDGVSLSPSKFQ